MYIYIYIYVYVYIILLYYIFMLHRVCWNNSRKNVTIQPYFFILSYRDSERFSNLSWLLLFAPVE